MSTDRSQNEKTETEIITKRVETSKKEIEQLKVEYERLIQQGISGSANPVQSKMMAPDTSQHGNNVETMPDQNSDNTETEKIDLPPSDVSVKNKPVPDILTCRDDNIKLDPKCKETEVRKCRSGRFPVKKLIRSPSKQARENIAASPKKARSYNVEQAREYMNKQKEKRISQLRIKLKESENTVEERKKKLKALHEKSLKIVAKNTRDRSKSRETRNVIETNLLPQPAVNRQLFSSNKPTRTLTTNTKTISELFIPSNITVRSCGSEDIQPAATYRVNRLHSEHVTKAAVAIQSCFRGYRQRKIYRRLVETGRHKERKQNVLEQEEPGQRVNLNDTKLLKKELPEWLQLNPQTHPYNFISVVKHKLNLAVSTTPKSTNDVGVQSTPQNSQLTSRTVKEKIERSIKNSSFNSEARLRREKDVEELIERNIKSIKDLRKPGVEFDCKKSAKEKSNPNLNLLENCENLDLKKVEAFKLKSKTGEHSDSDTSKNIPDLSAEISYSKKTSSIHEVDSDAASSSSKSGTKKSVNTTFSKEYDTSFEVTSSKEDDKHKTHRQRSNVSSKTAESKFGTRKSETPKSTDRDLSQLKSESQRFPTGTEFKKPFSVSKESEMNMILTSGRHLNKASSHFENSLSASKTVGKKLGRTILDESDDDYKLEINVEKLKNLKVLRRRDRRPEDEFGMEAFADKSGYSEKNRKIQDPLWAYNKSSTSSSRSSESENKNKHKSKISESSIKEGIDKSPSTSDSLSGETSKPLSKKSESSIKEDFIKGIAKSLSTSESLREERSKISEKRSKSLSKKSESSTKEEERSKPLPKKSESSIKEDFVKGITKSLSTSNSLPEERSKSLSKKSSVKEVVDTFSNLDFPFKNASKPTSEKSQSSVKEDFVKKMTESLYSDTFSEYRSKHLLKKSESSGKEESVREISETIPDNFDTFSQDGSSFQSKRSENLMKELKHSNSHLGSINKGTLATDSDHKSSHSNNSPRNASSSNSKSGLSNNNNSTSRERSSESSYNLRRDSIIVSNKSNYSVKSFGSSKSIHSKGSSVETKSLITENLPSTQNFKTLRSTSPETTNKESESYISDKILTEHSKTVPLIPPSVTLHANYESNKKNGNRNVKRGRVTEIKLKPGEKTCTDTVGNTNQIHVKFEAELHLLNDFNESLRQFMAIEKSLLDLQNKNADHQTRDTQTSLVSRSITEPTTEHTKDESIHTARTSKSVVSLNYSRGSDFYTDRATVPGNEMVLQESLNRVNTENSVLATTGLEVSELNDTTINSTQNNLITSLTTSNKDNSGNFYAGLSLGMFEQLIKDEDTRIENLKTILKIREKALLDRTKGELAWLEIQKKHLLETGKLHEASLVKKKQRGIIIKLQHEKHEMQKLKQIQKAASKERKTILKEQRNMIKAQLSTNNNVTKIKRVTSKERRLSGPLKVYDYHRETIKSEISVSKRSSVAEEIVYSRSESIISRLTEGEVTEAESIHSEENNGEVKNTVDTEMAKRSLVKREAALQKRRKVAEELLQWHQKLLEEERKITELEMAASNIINQVPTVSVDNSASGEKYRFVGSQLNVLWENMTGRAEKKFNDGDTYDLSQLALERFCKEANKYSSKKRGHEILQSNKIIETRTIPVIKIEAPIIDEIKENVESSADLQKGIKQSESTLNEIMQNISSITDEISELYKLKNEQHLPDLHQIKESETLVHPSEEIQGKTHSSTEDIIFNGPQSVPTDISSISDSTRKSSTILSLSYGNTHDHKVVPETSIESVNIKTAQLDEQTINDSIHSKKSNGVTSILEASKRATSDLQEDQNAVTDSMKNSDKSTHNSSSVSIDLDNSRSKDKDVQGSSDKNSVQSSIPGDVEQDGITSLSSEEHSISKNSTKKYVTIENIKREHSRKEENEEISDNLIVSTESVFEENVPVSESEKEELISKSRVESVTSEKEVIGNQIEEMNSLNRVFDSPIESMDSQKEDFDSDDNKISGSPIESIESQNVHLTNDDNQIERVISSKQISESPMDNLGDQIEEKLVKLSSQDENPEKITSQSSSPKDFDEYRIDEELLRSEIDEDLMQSIASQYSSSKDQIVKDPILISQSDQSIAMQNSSSKTSDQVQTDKESDNDEDLVLSITSRYISSKEQIEKELILNAQKDQSRSSASQYSSWKDLDEEEPILKSKNDEDRSESIASSVKISDLHKDDAINEPRSITGESSKSNFDDVPVNENKSSLEYNAENNTSTKISEHFEGEDRLSASENSIDKAAKNSRNSSVKNGTLPLNKSPQLPTSDEDSSRITDLLNDTDDYSDDIKSSSVLVKSVNKDIENEKHVSDVEISELTDKSSSTPSSDGIISNIPIIGVRIEEKKDKLVDDASDEGSFEEYANHYRPEDELSGDYKSSRVSLSESPKSQVNVKQRVSEILADAHINVSIGDKSPRLQNLYVTAYDVFSPEDSPELGSPGENQDFLPVKSVFGNEAEELLRKQLAIEQEIKQLEQQQKEQIPYLYMREIPNKPPPPYKPPILEFSALPPTVLPMTVEQINSMLPDLTKILYKAQTNNNLSAARLPEDNLFDDIDKECSEFLFDLCKELAAEHFSQFEEDESVSWFKLNKRVGFKRRLNEDGLRDFFSQKLLQIFGFEKVELKESMIIKWSRKKRDHVDELLVVESQTEEAEWTNYDQDELIVKNDVTNDILGMLMKETIDVFEQIIAKKVLNIC